MPTQIAFIDNSDKGQWMIGWVGLKTLLVGEWLIFKALAVLTLGTISFTFEIKGKTHFLPATPFG